VKQGDLLARFGKLPNQEFFDNLPTWEQLDKFIHSNVDLATDSNNPKVAAEQYFVGTEGIGPMSGKGAPTKSFQSAVERAMKMAAKSAVLNAALHNSEVEPGVVSLKRESHKRESVKKVARESAGRKSAREPSTQRTSVRASQQNGDEENAEDEELGSVLSMLCL